MCGQGPGEPPGQGHSTALAGTQLPNGRGALRLCAWGPQFPYRFPAGSTENGLSGPRVDARQAQQAVEV